MSALYATPVNRHYLEKVMSVAEVMEVEVIVDILDVRGLKLVAKGTQVTRALQEKLILHKLRQPFESCVRASGSVDARAIVAIASRLIDTSPSVAHIVRATSKGGASVLAQLGRLEFGSALGMMLTVADRSGAHALEHAAKRHEHSARTFDRGLIESHGRAVDHDGNGGGCRRRQIRC